MNQNLTINNFYNITNIVFQRYVYKIIYKFTVFIILFVMVKHIFIIFGIKFYEMQEMYYTSNRISLSLSIIYCFPKK